MAISEGDRMQAECMSLYDLTDGIFISYFNGFNNFHVLDLILEWKNKSFSTFNLTTNFKVIV
jgi:hypothetical protein